MITLPSGQKMNISGTPSVDTKAAAEAAERAHIHRMMYPQAAEVAVSMRKEVPTLREFAPTYLKTKRTKKHSYYETRCSLLNTHIIPAFGRLPLDAITYAQIQDYASGKLVGLEGKRKLAPKTVNNHLSVIRQVLVLAHKRGLIDAVPEIDWCASEESKFDFLSFDESAALVLAADSGDWKNMITLALNTGMRLGELRGLHWNEVNFEDGSLNVVNNYVRDRMTTPKSRTSKRVIPLNDAAHAALRAQRHLCGPLVFPEADGSPLKKGRTRWPLWRACDRAKIRRISWHVLRHTFASQLVMKGVPLKAAQELLGHSTTQMTERYAHLSPQVRRDAVQTLCESRIAT